MRGRGSSCQIFFIVYGCVVVKAVFYGNDSS